MKLSTALHAWPRFLPHHPRLSASLLQEIEETWCNLLSIKYYFWDNSLNDYIPVHFEKRVGVVSEVVVPLLPCNSCWDPSLVESSQRIWNPEVLTGLNRVSKSRMCIEGANGRHLAHWSRDGRWPSLAHETYGKVCWVLWERFSCLTEGSSPSFLLGMLLSWMYPLDFCSYLVLTREMQRELQRTLTTELLKSFGTSSSRLNC